MRLWKMWAKSRGLLTSYCEECSDVFRSRWISVQKFGWNSPVFGKYRSYWLWPVNDLIGIWNTTLNQFLRHLESSYKHSCPLHLDDANEGRRLILLLILQLISLEDLCASRYISWKNAVLCSCLLLLNDLVVSLAVMPYSSYDLPTEQKMLSICTSRHPKQLWTECSFRMPSSSSSEWGYTHLLILTVLDSHDMDMRNLCRCFSRRSQSSSQEMTCAHLTRGWTRFSCISLVVQGCMEQIRFKHRNFPRNLAPIKILTVK